MKKLLIALAGLSTIAVPCAANASATITFGSTTAIPGSNDFQANLAGLGLTRYATTGATISLDASSIITFYFLGSESGFSDTFSTSGALPNLSLTENSSFENHFGSPILIGSDTFGAGSLLNLLNFSSSGGANATVGSDGFGIFLGPNAVSGLTTNEFFVGYDDQVTNQDDNHDDFIIRAVVSAVPEPATWAMMLLGFAGIGLTARRNRKPQLAQLA